MASEGDTSRFIYDLPGQHVYQGVAYLGVQPEVSLQRIPGLKLTPEDIMVATYPEAGTTWMWEMADVIRHDGDTQKAARAPSYQRWWMLESGITGWFNVLETVKNSSPPRLIKTHVDVTLLSKQVCEQGVKTIVVLRNPKDCLVSYYQLYRMNTYYHNYTGSWEEFFEIFKAGQLIYGDPIDHMLGWWALRDLPNVEVFMYEHMLKDRAGTVRKMAQFLEKHFTDAQVEDIVKCTSFDSMKTQPSTNHSSNMSMKQTLSPCYRKGQAADWRSYFTEEQNRYMDEIIERKLAGTGLTFTFE